MFRFAGHTGPSNAVKSCNPSPYSWSRLCKLGPQQFVIKIDYNGFFQVLKRTKSSSNSIIPACKSHFTRHEILSTDLMKVLSLHLLNLPTLIKNDNLNTVHQAHTNRRLMGMQKKLKCRRSMSGSPEESQGRHNSLNNAHEAHTTRRLMQMQKMP